VVVPVAEEAAEAEEVINHNDKSLRRCYSRRRQSIERCSKAA
jgi:hypothetical protein